MNRRAAFLAILVLGLTAVPASAATAPARPKAVATPAPPMVFYVAKGAPDACGRGCDSWIAVDGQVDASAAPRFKKFLQRSGNRNLPPSVPSPDRMLSSYIVKMGADLGLLEVARSIKFESMHVLTREQIVRFGIDRREFVETPWTFENNGRSMARKAVVERNDADKSWRTALWRIICFNADQFELDFQRPALASSVLPTLSISNSISAAQYFK